MGFSEDYDGKKVYITDVGNFTDDLSSLSPSDLTLYSGNNVNQLTEESLPIGSIHSMRSDIRVIRDADIKGRHSLGIENVINVQPVPLEHESIFETDISLVRGIVQDCGFDMNKFTSAEMLKIARSDKLIDVLWQTPQQRFSNVINEENTWKCDSARDTMSLGAYIAYQMKRLNAEKDEEWTQDTYSCNMNAKVKFGTNFDLDAPELWDAQLLEIQKLPHWARLNDKDNMLDYLGYQVPGMNTVQAYLKVRGSRTPAHQENLNFCSVNINVGPGDTEWFAVGYRDWRKVEKLCAEKGLTFTSDAWWPCLEELQSHGVRVYRVIQKPGDMVFVNAGCIHWVQALSVCNNIAYNVGLMTKDQYEACIIRYEANKKCQYRSIVPMKHLTWRLANFYRGWIAPDLKKCLKHAMNVTLLETLMHLGQLSKMRVEKMVEEDYWFEHHGYKPNLLRFCSICAEEIFHVFLLCINADGQDDVRCLRCAVKKDEKLLHHKYYEQGFYSDYVQILFAFDME